MLLCDEILKLESRLLEDEIRKDPSLFGPILDDRFFEFGKSGRSFTKADCMEAGSLGEIKVEIEQFRVTELAADVVLATYRTVDRSSGDYANRSSIWKRTGGRWRMMFHQGTVGAQLSDENGQ